MHERGQNLQPFVGVLKDLVQKDEHGFGDLLQRERWQVLLEYCSQQLSFILRRLLIGLGFFGGLADRCVGDEDEHERDAVKLLDLDSLLLPDRLLGLDLRQELTKVEKLRLEELI